MLEWIEYFTDKITNLKDGITTFLNQITNIFNNIIGIFPNEMKSYFLIATTLLIALMFYNFIWGHK